MKESNFEGKKVKHSVLTDDYIVTEEIQNQNWQYLAESVLDVSKSNDIGKMLKMLPFVKKPIKVYINTLSKIYI